MPDPKGKIINKTFQNGNILLLRLMTSANTLLLLKFALLSETIFVAAFPLKSFTTSTCPQTIPAVSTSVSLTYQKSNDQTITARPSSEMQRNRLFSSPQKGAPTDEWACQHCTLLNPATRNVCELCCKTRSDAPKTVAPATRTGNVTTSSATGPNVSRVIFLY